MTSPDEFGEYRLLLEEDPRSGGEWTLESINDLVAGISYGGGQSEVKVSELSLVVVYSVTPIEEEESVEPEPAEDEQSVPEAESEPEPENTEQEGDSADDETQEDVSENPTTTNSTEGQP